MNLTKEQFRQKMDNNLIEIIKISTGLSVEDATKKYSKYFRILRENDIPIINNLSGPNEIPTKLPEYKTIQKGEISLGVKIKDTDIKGKKEEFYKEIQDWENRIIFIKEMYDKIDIDNQDENTGKDILMENKKLLGEYFALFLETKNRIILDM